MKTGNSIQGIGNQKGFYNITEGGTSQMSDRKAPALERDRISRKKHSNGTIPRLNGRFAIAQYTILDRFERNHVHWLVTFPI
jgi:hypothetical protein